MTLSFEDAVAYLTPRTAGRIKWSLGPTEALLESVGHPEREFLSVHVGGTNGKGSVAALIAEALRMEGWKVGLYTSPHLVSVRERMVVDGRPIPADAFAMWTARLRPVIDRTGASFFEATTAIAFADFASRGVEIGVVEVGLGGRLDSTNVIEPLVSVITSVNVEHADYLGRTIDAIAGEKAGIAKPETPLVVGPMVEPALRAVRVVAEDVGAWLDVVPAGERYQGPLALLGAHQRANAAIAERVLLGLPKPWAPSPTTVAAAFARTTVAGRLDVRGKFVFDVAHNPSAVKTLCDGLEELRPRRPIQALLGILSDKDLEAMVEQLSDAVDALWFTTPPSVPPDRQWDPRGAAKWGASARCIVEQDFARALEGVAHGAGTVLVTGSFHTVGDAMARLPGFQPLG